MKIKWKPLIVNLLIAWGVEVISGLLTMKNMGIYSQITKPPLSPPSWLFPIVWTILFTLMGISAYRIYIAPNRQKSWPLFLYGAQLIFNAVWSIIFFNLHAFLFSFIWLVLLLIFIWMMIFSFARIDKTAAWLQLPYALWVTFAGYLNLMIFLIN